MYSSILNIIGKHAYYIKIYPGAAEAMLPDQGIKLVEYASDTAEEGSEANESDDLLAELERLIDDPFAVDDEGE